MKGNAHPTQLWATSHHFQTIMRTIWTAFSALRSYLSSSLQPWYGPYAAWHLVPDALLMHLRSSWIDIVHSASMPAHDSTPCVRTSAQDLPSISCHVDHFRRSAWALLRRALTGLPHRNGPMQCSPPSDNCATWVPELILASTHTEEILTNTYSDLDYRHQVNALHPTFTIPRVPTLAVKRSLLAAARAPDDALGRSGESPHFVRWHWLCSTPSVTHHDLPRDLMVEDMVF
ncbi:hypothetical protein BDN71DRAFT_703091 [Pleurotus eryngii]|uniref:Uncharacterized protein n=1 Tax=Pleurotus eryngii TaxID=5323 RepID=A0A9P6DCA3_PLEER|nr:hypothetical protein BDN71DRAFT_703091 [Pleurotus eryngii]